MMSTKSSSMEDKRQKRSEENGGTWHFWQSMIKLIEEAYF